MATKQIQKTKPKPTQAKATKSRAKLKDHESAEAPGTKTRPAARDAARTPAKATGSTSRKSAQPSAAKAKGAGQSTKPDSRTKKPRPSPAATHQGKGRKHESNGHIAKHGKTAEVSKPRDEIAAGATTTPATQRKTARSAEAEKIFLNLFEALEAHAKLQRIGLVAKDAQFDWGETGNEELHPDLAFVSFDRWAAYRHVPKDLTWHVVPDLVVEIVRGSEQTEPISAWLEQYFRAGVNRVWVIYPDQLKVHDHDSLSSSRVLDHKQSLDGGSILAGFQLPLKELLKGLEI